MATIGVHEYDISSLLRLLPDPNWKAIVTPQKQFCHIGVGSALSVLVLVGNARAFSQETGNGNGLHVFRFIHSHFIFTVLSRES